MSRSADDNPVNQETPATSDGPPDPAAGFEAARLANLLHFASLTPDERVEWLTEMLELLDELRAPGISLR